MQSDTRPALSTFVRAATRAEHEAAEGSQFVAVLLAGRLEQDRYGEFLAQLACIYDGLEQASATMRANPVAAPFVAPELTRGPALDADLRFHIGDDWAARTKLLGATREYRARLDEYAASDPMCFIAHHYTRSLGDLSGGQILRQAVAESYDLDGEDGVRFYNFAEIQDPRAFKGRYRAHLDALTLDSDEQWRFVDEVARAYRLNARLFAELVP